ncbi:hypothetical protein SAMD00019534_069610 [Acytostelium subglobosum LB1]|uniref:hypothetical protein n=1 Tax=Acytostelium subglobosum LB1 TaxID=1410327 RepID=UPI000644B1B5|nr:hypothetical protein SAMD00019534_069610 [Acytostelium subglobosum LB1]GAM23786.1 hypothetical protein SAMD00019534_069610 [Acytostelium subglobosum LB1]|eukprot:XP_012753527.1 hypothetical protein SAMD00019534_069610 [Acytostelium subglobosum LB1]
MATALERLVLQALIEPSHPCLSLAVLKEVFAVHRESIYHHTVASLMSKELGYSQEFYQLLGSLSLVCWKWFRYITKRFFTHLSLDLSHGWEPQWRCALPETPLSFIMVTNIFLYNRPQYYGMPPIVYSGSKCTLLAPHNILRLSVHVTDQESDAAITVDMVRLCTNLQTVDLYAQLHQSAKVDNIAKTLQSINPLLAISLTVAHAGLCNPRADDTGLWHPAFTNYQSVHYLAPTCFVELPLIIRPWTPNRFTFVNVCQSWIGYDHDLIGDREHTRLLIAHILQTAPSLAEVDFGTIPIELEELTQTVSMANIRSVTCRLELANNLFAKESWHDGYNALVDANPGKTSLTPDDACSLDANVILSELRHFDVLCKSLSTSSIERLTCINNWPEYNHCGSKIESVALFFMQFWLANVIGESRLSHLHLCGLPLVSDRFFDNIQGSALLSLFLTHGAMLDNYIDSLNDAISMNKSIPIISLQCNHIGLDFD